MFRRFNDHGLLKKALDRISKSGQAKEKAESNVWEEFDDHTPFNILKYIENPNRYA